MYIHYPVSASASALCDACGICVDHNLVRILGLLVGATWYVLTARYIPHRDQQELCKRAI